MAAQTKSQFIKAPNGSKPVHLTLEKNLARTVKLGHPWIFADSLSKLPPAAPGSLALCKTKNGQIIAKGFYDPKSPLAFKSLALVNERLDDGLLQRRLHRSWNMRMQLFDRASTNAYRLFNGEGDGLPGLVCDIYNDTAVFKLDGAGAEGFYDVQALAEWLLTQHGSPIKTVFQRFKSNSASRGKLIIGDYPEQPVHILENGAIFQVDVVNGQKTGFFLDQRDSRACVGRLCRAAAPSLSSSSKLRCLNVFGYTGGFSVYAGRSNASNVTTVDVADKALQYATANWALNGLRDTAHESVRADAFDFLEDAAKSKEKWDLVIVDPPSFAPNQASVERAKSSYKTLFTNAAQCVQPNGILALSSCSSHINASTFSEICCSALAAAQRPGYALVIAGQPEDHPSPIFAEELRYLKFNCYQLEG
ncbi:S-adenosyl-L-methionine-dependent methyltransferase [Dunaliella salina]|uniref:S-adenosyl-L-methionine-dependent methyltransferase n=1 Tax=Dunaliella salina TaxID=3046 RepID=A0ABQ7GI62_DUNSA|nr:S-adenosyl-L-methionine-dependent methyltransferase [Dunaliella salina]|eukprot:KAF5834297.1 S-adenosyl-L-methionine-dependent methyltransferase [Dunaliella salina]